MDVEQTIFIPPDFYCPITGDIMVDPVSDNGGHTFCFLCLVFLFLTFPLRATIPYNI